MKDLLYSYPKLSMDRIFGLLASEDESLGDATEILILSTPREYLQHLFEIMNDLVSKEVQADTIFLMGVTTGYTLGAIDGIASLAENKDS